VQGENRLKGRLGPRVLQERFAGSVQPLRVTPSWEPSWRWPTAPSGSMRRPTS